MSDSIRMPNSFDTDLIRNEPGNQPDPICAWCEQPIEMDPPHYDESGDEVCDACCPVCDED